MVQDFWLTPQILHINYCGTVTGKEVNQATLFKSGDPRFDDLKFIISDWRHAEHYNIDLNEIDELVAYLRIISKQCPYVKAASLTKPDKSGNALAAYYIMLGEILPWEFEIFHTLEDAYAWFGIACPEDPLVTRQAI